MPPSTSDTPIRVFFSYAHQDEHLRDELAKQLKILERNGTIQGWHDRKITPGSEWKGEIDQHLERAQIILLLISPDFLNSDYCWEVEMRKAMEYHESQKATVIPVILRHCPWQIGPFAKLQALPKNAKPIASWTDRDEALTNVADGVFKVANRIRAFNST
jgi:TIR domain